MRRRSRRSWPSSSRRATFPVPTGMTRQEVPWNHERAREEGWGPPPSPPQEGGGEAAAVLLRAARQVAVLPRLHDRGRLGRLVLLGPQGRPPGGLSLEVEPGPVERREEQVRRLREG